MDKKDRGSEVTRCSCSSHGSFLTAKGLKEAAQRLSLEGLAPRGDLEYVDKVVSVSALVEGEGSYDWPPEPYIEEQYRRFLNGT